MGRAARDERCRAAWLVEAGGDATAPVRCRPQPPGPHYTAHLPPACRPAHPPAPARRSTLNGRWVPARFRGSGKTVYRHSLRVWDLPAFTLAGELVTDEAETNGFMTAQFLGSSGIVASGECVHEAPREGSLP